MRVVPLIAFVVVCCMCVLGANPLVAQPQAEYPIQSAQNPPFPQPIAYGEHTIGCSIIPAGDEDRFVFNGSAGDQVRISARSLANCLDLTVIVHSPLPPVPPSTLPPVLASSGCNGHCGWPPGNCCVCTVAIWQATLPVSGPYIIRVSDDNNVDTGGFQLQLERIVPTVMPPMLGFGSAGSRSDTLQQQTDTDWFTFLAYPGNTIYVIVQSNSNCLDLGWQVFDASGAAVGSAYGCDGHCGWPPGNCCICQAPATITIPGALPPPSPLPLPSTYYLAVYDTNFDAANVNYTVTLQCQNFFPPFCPVPTPPHYPGSADDFMMLTATTSAGNLLGTGGSADIKPAVAGDILTVQFSSPGGTFNGSPFMLGAQFFVTGSPAPSGQVPNLWLTAPGLFILVDGYAATPFGPFQVLAPGGTLLHFLVPVGLTGNSLMLQGALLSSQAQNMLYALTDAHEIQLL